MLLLSQTAIILAINYKNKTQNRPKKKLRQIVHLVGLLVFAVLEKLQQKNPRPLSIQM